MKLRRQVPIVVRAGVTTRYYPAYEVSRDGGLQLSHGGQRVKQQTVSDVLPSYMLPPECGDWEIRFDAPNVFGERPAFDAVGPDLASPYVRGDIARTAVALHVNLDKMISARRDAELARRFVADPAATLAEHAIVKPGQAVEIRSRDTGVGTFDVLVYPSDPAGGEPEALVFKPDNIVKSFLEKLPRPFDVSEPRPCPIPGGCSGSF